MYIVAAVFMTFLFTACETSKQKADEETPKSAKKAPEGNTTIND